MQIENRKSSPSVTWRSVLLGLFGVLFICGLSSYNDFVLANTFIVGNFMPIGVLLMFVSIVLVINAPLLQWRPAWALSPGELTVAMSMSLVSCGLASAGLMRYLPPQLVGLWYWGGSTTDYTQLLRNMNLPDWLFPAFAATDPVDRASDPLAQNFFSRIPGTPDSFLGRFFAVPWGSWLHPAVAWGLFTLALFGAIFCLLLIVRRQWTENERLAFPLASIYAAVIEPPEQGRAINRLFRSRAFWIAFAVVFAIHSGNALRGYWPKYFPEIPIKYNFNTIFANEPWVFLEGDMKSATLYFCIIGIAYFLPSQISLSIWLFYVIYQINVMICGTYRVELTAGMKSDQFMGALVPYALALVWIGRNHWKVVIGQMFRGAKPGESQGRYLPYAFTGWALIGFVTLGVLFLCAAGATLVGAIACMAMALTLHLCVARIVAETGLPFVNFNGNLDRPFYAFLNSQGHGPRTTTRSFFITQMIASAYVSDIRESTAVYTSHAYRMADDIYGDRPDKSAWRRTLPFTLCIVAALVLGFVTAGAGKLYAEYNYAVSLDMSQRSPLDTYGTDQNIRENIFRRAAAYDSPAGPREAHTRLEHIGIGAVVSLGLAVARLKSVSFPLHPVGYLLGYSWPVSKIWFSMFIGWIVKQLIVRFGGSSAYFHCREFFIGLILGEAGVAAFWMVVSILLNALGQPYRLIQFLPN